MVTHLNNILHKPIESVMKYYTNSKKKPNFFKIQLINRLNNMLK